MCLSQEREEGKWGEGPRVRERGRVRGRERQEERERDPSLLNGSLVLYQKKHMHVGIMS